MGPFNSPRPALPPFTIFPSQGTNKHTEWRKSNKPGLAGWASCWAAAALLAVFRIPFRPRVSPFPCRLKVSPLFCLDKVSPLFRERVSPLFRLKVSPLFRVKVPSLRGPKLSSFLLPMLLVRDGSSIFTPIQIPWLLVWLVHSQLLALALTLLVNRR